MLTTINSKRAEKKINKAKSKARPELTVDDFVDEWKSLNLAKKLGSDLDRIARVDTLDRVNVDIVSCEEFIDRYEKLLKPAIITNVTNSWPAKEKWTMDNFLKYYRNERFKCGEDDYGYNVKMKMKYFVYYMKTNCDDSPLYIFDGNFGEHRRKKQLLKEYLPPKYFKEDLFKYVGSSRRPPYKWIVIGSSRSGTGIHIDPLGTSAWNTLLVGYKRWCLFPTHTPRELLKLNPSTGGKQCSEAAQWFNLIYPRTQMSDWPSQFKPIEILQRPHETVYVPSGWWHVVMNMSETIAITQNFVSTTNFPIVWHKTVRSRPKLSKKWLAQLRIHRQDLVESTRKIDIYKPIGITSDSSSGSSSSSSSSTSSSASSSSSTYSSCGCSSCKEAESTDSGQETESKMTTNNNSNNNSNNRKKRKRRSLSGDDDDDVDDSRGGGSAGDNNVTNTYDSY